VASLTETLKDRLASYRQIKLSAVDRKSGRIEGGFSVRTKNVAATEIALKFVRPSMHRTLTV
jgi:hypothetical protein